MTQHFYVIRISLKSKLKAHSCLMSELELVLNFYYSSFILFYSIELNYNKSNNKYCTKQTTIIYIFLISRISIIIKTYVVSKNSNKFNWFIYYKIWLLREKSKLSLVNIFFSIISKLFFYFTLFFNLNYILFLQSES